MYGHSLFPTYFVLLLQCDKLPSPHFLQALLRVWIYLCPSNTELKDSQDISQMACITAQKQYFACRGRGELETWMKQPGWSCFNMHLLHGKFEKAKSETAKWFSIVTGKESFVFDIRIPMKSHTSTMHNKAEFGEKKSQIPLLNVLSVMQIKAHFLTFALLRVCSL